MGWSDKLQLTGNSGVGRYCSTVIRKDGGQIYVLSCLDEIVHQRLQAEYDEYGHKDVIDSLYVIGFQQFPVRVRGIEIPENLSAPSVKHSYRSSCTA